MPEFREIRQSELRRAVEIYLACAYPDGDLPAAVRRRLEWMGGDAEMVDLARPPFEPVAPESGEGPAIYALRLGNRVYPHMKLQIQRWSTAAGFLVSVNTHDQVLAPAPDSPDAEAFRTLLAENQRTKLAIEAAWDAEGMPTFLRYLRDYIDGDVEPAGSEPRDA